MTTRIHPLYVLSPNLILLREKKILLLKKGAKVSSFHGLWGCPSGGMEPGETPKETIIRETYEEIGLHVNPHLATSIFVNARNILNPQERWSDLSLFFVATEFDGEPVNREPTKCEVLEWCDLHDLPSPMIPSVKFGLECYRQGHTYGEFYEH